MLDSQLRPNGIDDEALLAAMETLPRERFLPERLRGIAYVDEDVVLGGGHFLMEPLVPCALLQLADVGKTDKALDVGCGTGYATAVLANRATMSSAWRATMRWRGRLRSACATSGSRTPG